MSAEGILFLALLALNVTAVLVYVLRNYYLSRVKMEQIHPDVWFCAVVMLLCPVVGTCFVLFGYVLQRKTAFRADVAQEYNMAAFEGKTDEFWTNVQNGYSAVCANPKEELDRGVWMLDYMDPVLAGKSYPKDEQKQLVHIMDEIGDLLYRHHRKKMASAQLEALSLRLLDISDYDNCQKWCDRAEYLFPNELATYTCQLKLFFNMGKRYEFFRVLEELQNSDIVVDNETLELIRVFL